MCMQLYNNTVIVTIPKPYPLNFINSKTKCTIQVISMEVLDCMFKCHDVFHE